MIYIIFIIVFFLASIYFSIFGKGKIKVVAQKILLALLLMIIGFYGYIIICNLLSDIINIHDWVNGSLIAVVCIYYSIRGYQFVCRKIFVKKETVAIENKDDSKDKEIG